MEVSVQHRPSYALAVARLEPDESIQVEAGSMVGMSAGVQVETGARGGLLKSLARSMLGGESFFMNTYRAPSQGGQLMLAPALPGDMVVRQLEGETLLVQSGSYVASSEDIDISTGWGGAKTFFAREGLILLKISGTGTLVLSSYGAIEEVELGQGETFTVDTGHLVAFSDRLGFKVRRVGGLKSTLFSGEGLVVDLTGPGRFWLQSRSEDAFLTWLIPKIPRRESGD
ncbi:MAG: TIGR00266 family protein [Anaerolineae bacterium]